MVVALSRVQSEIVQLPLTSIRTDGGTQPRINQDWKIIGEYAQDMLEGAVFPPVIVYYDDTDYWLADGFHRYHATKQIDRETITAEVRQGSQRDAILFSVGVNSHHGFRRKNEDKRVVVEKLLRDEEWTQWSDYKIAKACCVSQPFVLKIRQELEASNNIIRCDDRLVERNGTIYSMNAANIGHSQPQEAPTERVSLADVFDPVAHTIPTAYLPQERVDWYERWQRDNLTLGLDRFGDPSPAETPIKSSALTALQSSESNEWYTPGEYIDAAHKLMGGIDLDPASCQLANETVKATNYYDIAQNGLNQDWPGRIWLNPPYGLTDGESNQAVWSGHLIDQFKNKITTEAVLLVNANTEAKWFQPLYDYLICLTNHRIRFYSANGESSQPTQGNALVYFGPKEKHEQFKKIFSKFGHIGTFERRQADE